MRHFISSRAKNRGISVTPPLLITITHNCSQLRLVGSHNTCLGAVAHGAWQLEYLKIGKKAFVYGDNEDEKDRKLAATLAATRTGRNSCSETWSFLYASTYLFAHATRVRYLCDILMNVKNECAGMYIRKQNGQQNGHWSHMFLGVSSVGDSASSWIAQRSL